MQLEVHRHNSYPQLPMTIYKLDENLPKRLKEDLSEHEIYKQPTEAELIFQAENYLSSNRTSV